MQPIQQGEPYGADVVARQQMWSLTQRLAAIEQVPQPTCRLVSASVTAAVLGGTVDVTVVWPAPMPSAVYTVEPVAATGLIGRATLAVKSQTREGCVITVTAGLAVAAGALLIVHART